jgi:hypothetical protein
MSEATSAISAISDNETEVVNVTIPYVSIPSSPELHADNTQEAQEESSVKEVEKEITVNTSERKNSWVWSFYRQVQTSNGDVFTVCNVEIDSGTKCNKRYKTKGSTGNLISHLLKHGITKDNPQPSEVCKIIITNYFLIL